MTTNEIKINSIFQGTDDFDEIYEQYVSEKQSAFMENGPIRDMENISFEDFVLDGMRIIAGEED
ncbi:hypothetical protein FACS1894132_13720 [Clostridia bacterium]|nr:hypothetical protein FACS1894132_13720 [Clostridia bacterium]